MGSSPLSALNFGVTLVATRTFLIEVKNVKVEAMKAAMICTLINFIFKIDSGRISLKISKSSKVALQSFWPVKALTAIKIIDMSCTTTCMLLRLIKLTLGHSKPANCSSKLMCSIFFPLGCIECHLITDGHQFGTYYR